MDSLNAKYGEPTKIIKDVAIEPDINKEIIFYENAKKVICMGKTIDFKDIINCEVVDDPKFIPGYKTTYEQEFHFSALALMELKRMLLLIKLYTISLYI